MAGAGIRIGKEIGGPSPIGPWPHRADQLRRRPSHWVRTAEALDIAPVEPRSAAILKTLCDHLL